MLTAGPMNSPPPAFVFPPAPAQASAGDGCGALGLDGRRSDPLFFCEEPGQPASVRSFPPFSSFPRDCHGPPPNGTERGSLWSDLDACPGRAPPPVGPHHVQPPAEAGPRRAPLPSPFIPLFPSPCQSIDGPVSLRATEKVLLVSHWLPLIEVVE